VVCCASLRNARSKSLSVSPIDIRGFRRLIQGRNVPQKHAWQAEIVLLTTEGVGTNEIMPPTANPRPFGGGRSSVQRIWRAHGLQPHRVRPLKLSNDLSFADKLCDVVGLYVDPPA
jgi:hypothetical protein